MKSVVAAGSAVLLLYEVLDSLSSFSQPDVKRRVSSGASRSPANEQVVGARG